MTIKRKRKVAKKASSPAIVKQLRKQITQWKLKCSQLTKKQKLIKEQAYKKGFNDALKAFAKMQKAEAKLVKLFKAECKKKMTPKKTTKRKTVKRKTATKRKAAPKRKTAIKRKAAPKRKTAVKRKAAPKRKTTTKRKTAAKRKAAPRRKTVVRKTKSRSRVVPARRSSLRGNSAYRSH